MTNNLLILERSSTELEFKQEGGTYVLEGIFGEIDKKNRNNRIYTESEYLPQIETLQAKIKSSKLLGELDHPQTFDVSLKNVSHIIEELNYDSETKQVKGRIRLLDTDAGRQAKALVDAGVPLQISSRAAGAVESNGTVKIKQLFTYDLVADPGFENAELKRVNEAFGFLNEGNDLFIYEIDSKKENEKQPIENINETKMAESKFITVEDFNKYSKYLSEEIKSIKEGMNSLTEAESTSSQLGTLKEYTDYLAKKLEESIAYSEHIAEKADKGIQYSENLAVKLDQGIQYSEHIASKVDQSIQYSEHIAESVDTIKNYTNYLAESYNEGSTSYDNLIKYTEYLRENLEKVTEYAEYVAETVNSNLLLEDEAGVPAEDLNDETADVTAPVVDADGNVITGTPEDKEKELELAGSGDAAGSEIKEAHEGTEAGLPAEDIKKATKNVTVPVVDADGNVITGTPEDKEKELELAGSGDAAGKQVDQMEAYKNSITSKLEALVEKVNAKKSENPTFFKFISEEKVTEFNALSTEEKSKVVSAVEGRGYLTEGQILALWNTSLSGTVETYDAPAVIKLMPTEYHDTWAKCSEGKKNQILAQSKYHKVETAYQVANFWQTRDLRDVAPIMEKITMVNESAVEEVKTLGYDATELGAEIAKRFNR